MCRSVKRHDSGFTLIEVLVAVAILVIVIGAIYGAFRAGNQSSVFLEESSDLHQTTRVILAQISSELSSLHPIPGEQTSDLVGEHTDVASGSLYFDKLRFTTVSHKPSIKNAIQGDACMVTYSAECTADGEPLGLFLIEDFTPGLHNSQEDIDALPASMVSDLVVGMGCSYLDPDSGEWVDEWVDKTVLPKAVRVELVLQSKRKGSAPITVASTTNIPVLAQQSSQTSGNTASGGGSITRTSTGGGSTSGGRTGAQ